MQDGGQLGGKRKRVATLFSDIRSFTTISEGILWVQVKALEPNEVVDLLNKHFGYAINAIMSEGGIILVNI